MANAGEFPKVDGDIIYRDDYNLVRQSVENTLSGFWGSTFSAPPLAGNPTITAAGVQLLINDINKAYTHITGSNSSLPAPTSGLIIDNQLWSDMAVAAQYIDTNKLEIGPGQFADSTVTWTLLGGWNGQYGPYWRDLTWSSAAAATNFFATGGRIFLGATSADSNGSAKSTDWATNIIGAMPTQVYDYNKWIVGTDVTVTEFGNQAQYTENYLRLNITKISSTRLRLSWVFDDADTGDQTGLGAAVDENVGLTVNINSTVRSSTGVIVGPAVSFEPLVDNTPPPPPPPPPPPFE